MSMPTSEQMVSRYLFDLDVPPEDLKDEHLIRAKDAEGRAFIVDMNEYMTTGAGRFVGIEEFNFVRRFLAGDDYEGKKLAPGVYSTADLLDAYNIRQSSRILSVDGYTRGVDQGDYADRAYVFGTGGIELMLMQYFTLMKMVQGLFSI